MCVLNILYVMLCCIFSVDVIVGMHIQSSKIYRMAVVVVENGFYDQRHDSMRCERYPTVQSFEDARDYVTLTPIN